MRFLVTGATGQAGRALCCEGHARGYDITGLTHAQLDITRADEVSDAIRVRMPDAVINAAAYTAVDAAEHERDAAFAVNRDGPARLADACAQHGVPLIHISTDYVFDGMKSGAYVEDDPVCPLGIYGMSKQTGEAEVSRRCPHHIILRTSWVFSAHGHNFVKTMLRLAHEQEELRVVADQRGCPTSASVLAAAILDMTTDMDGKWGVYHFCQPEAVSWHGFAGVILDAARKCGGIKARCVVPIATEDYPVAAKRPANSVLDCGKFDATFGIVRPPWRESVRDVVKEVCA